MSELGPNQLDALEQVRRKPELQPFFFRKLSGLKWFDELVKQGFFDPQHNPNPIESDKAGYFTVPGWPVLEFLTETAPELLIPGNHEFIDKYLKVLRSVTETCIAEDVSNYRTWLSFAQILAFIPIDKLSSGDINLIGYWLTDAFDRMLVWTEIGSKLLPRLLEADTEHSRRLAVLLLQKLTTLTWQSTRWGSEGEEEPALQVEAYWANEVLSGVSRRVGERLEATGAGVFKERLKEIFDKTSKDHFSTVWRPAIEDHEQNSNADDTTSILIAAFRDAMLGYADRRASAAEDHLRSLIESDTIVFQRIAIYVIGQFTEQFRQLAGQLVSEKWLSYQYQHEMFGLLKACAAKFDSRQIERLIEAIRMHATSCREPEESREIQNQQEAYAALGWLSAVRYQGWKSIDDLYISYRSISKIEPEHPEFSSYFSSEWIGDQSPFTVEELLSREFSGFLEILQNFQESGEWKSPTRRGLALTVKAAIKSRPRYFEGNLQRLIGIHHDYTAQILDGYRELWKDGHYGNWEELLAYCRRILSSDGFWGDNSVDRSASMTASHSSVVGAIAELIRTGTASDKNSYDKNLLPITKEILVIALEKQRSSDFSESKDAVSVAINSPRGKLIKALFNFALRTCRIADAMGDCHKNTWEKELRPLFDHQVDLLEAGNLEFATLYANYIPNLLYLDWDWTIERLPLIFAKDNQLRWVCAMQGYGFVNRVYTGVYKFLRDNGHILNALDSENIESRGKDKLIQNVVIEYLRGTEDLTDAQSLLLKILERWQDDELREVIWFLWTLRDGKKNEHLPKVLDLWKETARRSDRANKADQKILARLCSLSVYIEILDDDARDLIMLGAPFVEREHDSYILIEQLRRLVDTYPNQVADIYLCMLEEFAPTYQQENVEQTLSLLYGSGGELRQKANKIFDEYVKHGVNFIIDLRVKLDHDAPRSAD